MQILLFISINSVHPPPSREKADFVVSDIFASFDSDQVTSFPVNPAEQAPNQPPWAGRDWFSIPMIGLPLLFALIACSVTFSPSATLSRASVHASRMLRWSNTKCGRFLVWFLGESSSPPGSYRAANLTDNKPLCLGLLRCGSDLPLLPLTRPHYWREAFLVLRKVKSK